MLTVDNLLGRGRHDVWTVNVDTDYHETATVPGTGRDALLPPTPPP
jgi:hypothetical protein